MNPEIIHDALTLLPGDLITPVDKLRSHPAKPKIHWHRWAALAACLAVIICINFLLQQGKGGSTESITMQTPAEAPAAAAPMDQEVAAEEAAPKEAAPQEPAADPAASVTGSGNTNSSHKHDFAEDPQVSDDMEAGYCGNMITVIHIGENSFSISGSDCVTLTDILIHLDYDQQKICNCLGEFTVDTEMLSGIEVNLTEGYARCEKGQAALTEEQVGTIQDILNRVTE